MTCINFYWRVLLDCVSRGRGPANMPGTEAKAKKVAMKAPCGFCGFLSLRYANSVYGYGKLYEQSACKLQAESSLN